MRLALAIFMLSFLSTVVQAQEKFDVVNLVLTEEQKQELKAWLEEARVWQDWYNKYYNRPQYSMSLRGRPKDRKPQPPVPQWLPVLCSNSAFFNESTKQLAEACQVLDLLGTEISVESEDLQALSIAKQRTANELVNKNSFLSHVLLDTPHMLAEVPNSYGVFSYIGMHIGIPVKGRLQVSPPGFMLMSLRERGHRLVTPGISTGVSFRVSKLALPQVGMTSFHVNFSHVWVSSASAVPGAGTNFNMVGMSLSFR
jgi:hypothetical protein